MKGLGLVPAWDSLPPPKTQVIRCHLDGLRELLHPVKDYEFVDYELLRQIHTFRSPR